MSEDPKPSDIERELFDVGRDEKPSSESRARALAALGLTGVTPGGGGGASSGGAPAPSGALVSAKTVVAVLAGIAIGVIGSQLVTSARAPEPALTPTATASATAAAATTTEPLPIASATAPPPASPSASASAPSAPTASTAPLPVARASAPTPAPSADTDTLAAELAKLDGVRARLASGNASSALTELAAYDAAFPRGALRNEATVLRIEALMKAGRREDAKKLGDVFLRSHATDVSGQRVRRLLDAP